MGLWPWLPQLRKHDCLRTWNCLLRLAAASCHRALPPCPPHASLPQAHAALTSTWFLGCLMARLRLMMRSAIQARPLKAMKAPNQSMDTCREGKNSWGPARPLTPAAAAGGGGSGRRPSARHQGRVANVPMDVALHDARSHRRCGGPHLLLEKHPLRLLLGGEPERLILVRNHTAVSGASFGGRTFSPSAWREAAPPNPSLRLLNVWKEAATDFRQGWTSATCPDLTSAAPAAQHGMRGRGPPALWLVAGDALEQFGSRTGFTRHGRGRWEARAACVCVSRGAKVEKGRIESKGMRWTK